MLHTPTSQPLFIRHKSAAELLEKQAAAVARMPDDDKRWPAQVLSEMHKQLPFLSRFDVDIEMTRIEPEAGYALGYAMLRNKTGKQRAAEELGKPTNKIRVPVIVADRLLQPFHVFEVGGKTYPLTQERLESAMMNPSMFDGISDPPGTQSLLDQIYPPFQHRQGYGMMSGDRATTGVSKISSAPRVTKTASGEFGPLREFLQRAEIEKQAMLNAGAAATEVKGGLQALGKALGKPARIPRVQAPPVAPDVASSLSQVGKGTARTAEEITQLRATRSASRQPAPPQPLQQRLAGIRAKQPAAQAPVVPTAPVQASPAAPVAKAETLKNDFAAVAGPPTPGLFSAAPPAPVRTAPPASGGASNPSFSSQPVTTATAPPPRPQGGGGDATAKARAGAAESTMLPTGPEEVMKRPEWSPSAGFGRQAERTGTRIEVTDPTAARAGGGASTGARGEGLPVTTGSGPSSASRGPRAEVTGEAPTTVSGSSPRAEAGTPRSQDLTPLESHNEALNQYRDMPDESVRGLANSAGINNNWLNSYARKHGVSSGHALHSLQSDFLATKQLNPKITFEGFMGAQQARGGLFGGKYSPTGTPAGGGFLGSAVGGATMLGVGALGGGMMMANKASENY